MSAEVRVEDAVAGLYRLPLAEFVVGRDQLARQLRAAGDRKAARRVAALRRPSISAWAANQLAQATPHAMAQLLEAGQECAMDGTLAARLVRGELVHPGASAPPLTAG
jgi:hypothetical protein